MLKITYHPGTGVKDKAEFRLGKAKVPASVVTRLINNLNGKAGAGLDRVFYQGMAKYATFLEAMESGNITPEDAVKQFTSLKPGKPGKLRIEREAEGVAKILAKKYANLTPEVMVEKFVATANKPEFMKEVVDILKSYERQFKRNGFGRIKTSGRTGNSVAIKALAEFRAKKGKKK